MKIHLLIVILLCAYSSVTQSAAADPFSSDGFSVGMSFDDASLVHPESQWVETDVPLAGHLITKISKLFPTKHLGLDAEAEVQVGPRTRHVVAVGFHFRPSSLSQCKYESELVFSRLISAYGSSFDLLFAKPMVAKWKAGNFTVSFTEECSIGKRYFYVSYS